jgi:hypothetical protein
MEGALGNLLAEWKKVRESSVPAANASLKKAGMEELDPEKGSSATPVGDSDDGDEP